MSRKIFLIAGEISGDLLGASLMRDLKETTTEEIIFSGIGGADMTREGLNSLFPMSDLSLMGLVEVIKHLPQLIRRFNQTIDAILEHNPDILVTIDAPDFCLRIAKKIKKLRPQIKIIHYVAPTVWAWRPGRAKKIAQFLDGILCLFPFEPPYFEKHGLAAKFVGHPLVNLIPEFFTQQKMEFCTSHGLNSEKPILCVLPGSRHSEIDNLTPLIGETIKRLKIDLPDLQVIIPTLPHLRERLAMFETAALVFVPQDNAEKYLAFASSTVALHASGTVALELALCVTPMVTIYKVSTVTAFIAKFLIKTKFANLVNILLDFAAVPELIQENATTDKITYAVHSLLVSPAERNIQQQQLIQVAAYLKENVPHSAARFIIGL